MIKYTNLALFTIFYTSGSQPLHSMDHDQYVIISLAPFCFLSIFHIQLLLVMNGVIGSIAIRQGPFSLI